MPRIYFYSWDWIVVQVSRHCFHPVFSLEWSILDLVFQSRTHPTDNCNLRLDRPVHLFIPPRTIDACLVPFKASQLVDGWILYRAEPGGHWRVSHCSYCSSDWYRSSRVALVKILFLLSDGSISLFESLEDIFSLVACVSSEGQSGVCVCQKIILSQNRSVNSSLQFVFYFDRRWCSVWSSISLLFFIYSLAIIWISLFLDSI